MSAEAARAKWDRIYSEPQRREPAPARVLEENAHLLPPSGHALDLACGLGGNALFLARRGFKVAAWDISPAAVGDLALRASRLGLAVDAQARDVEAEPFPRTAFDAVVVSRFLARRLARPIVDSLKPGGLLFYQTYCLDKPGPQGPSNPAYLLAENELLALFGELRLLVYREEGRVGDLASGWRGEACLVGQKRPNPSAPAEGRTAP